MEDISCIFCGKRSGHVAIEENGYHGVKCDTCKLIYISPRPSSNEIKQIYTDDHAILYADAEFRFQSVNRMEAALTLSKIQRYRKHGSILELGPGGGSFLVEARSFGYDPYAIELNPIEARWMNEKLHIPCEDAALNGSSFGGRQFDIVYHQDVLSHLYDPISVFHDINRALKKGGLLVFETGNIADLEKKYYKWFSQFFYPDHLFFFGEKSLRILLERTGFKCICIHKQAILLQLLLQKILWRIKDSLKDKKEVEEMRSAKDPASESKRLSLKRRLRLLYRYVTHYLVRCGAILPKEGRPLKLLVITEKEPEMKARE